jgi:hypothetical protein
MSVHLPDKHAGYGRSKVVTALGDHGNVEQGMIRPGLFVHKVYYVCIDVPLSVPITLSHTKVNLCLVEIGINYLVNSRESLP